MRHQSIARAVESLIRGQFASAAHRNFPNPKTIERLMRDWHVTSGQPQPELQALYMGDADVAAGWVKAASTTSWAAGFSRYSVDEYWMIPHFEKMLYDNGAR